MGQKTITQFFDDIDGSPLEGASTVSFAFERKIYEIDLSPENRAALEDSLAPFIKAARPAGTISAGRSASASTETGPDLAAVRAWAAKNGHKISDRGRVPAAILSAYNAR